MLRQYAQTVLSKGFYQHVIFMPKRAMAGMGASWKLLRAVLLHVKAAADNQ